MDLNMIITKAAEIKKMEEEIEQKQGQYKELCTELEALVSGTKLGTRAAESVEPAFNRTVISVVPDKKTDSVMRSRILSAMKMGEGTKDAIKQRIYKKHGKAAGTSAAFQLLADEGVIRCSSGNLWKLA